MYNVPIPKVEPDSYIVKFYERLRSSNNIASVHVPRRDVYYVRFKIFEDTGEWYDAEHVEISMWLEGMLPLDEVKKLPQWYIDKYMGGAEVDFEQLKKQIRKKIAHNKRKNVPVSAELEA